MADRHDRYSGILPIDKLKSTACTVIGVGAIGRQVALQLSIIGIGELNLIDPDTVEIVNLGAQGYRPDQITLLKITATGEDCIDCNPEITIIEHPVKFNSDIGLSPVVFMCVDSIKARQNIFKILKHQTTLLIDGRMGSETLRVLTAFDAPTVKYYRKSLFPQSEQTTEPCTARSTFYCASIAAGFMVSQFSAWLRGLPIRNDYVVNILTKEVFFDIESK